MGRRVAPWMVDSIAHDKAREAERKAAEKARGARRYAVLPWRGDARYDGKDVIRWFAREHDAGKFAEKINGGMGIAVRHWTNLRNPDEPTTTKSDAEIAREVAEAAARYR